MGLLGLLGLLVVPACTPPEGVETANFEGFTGDVDATAATLVVQVVVCLTPEADEFDPPELTITGHARRLQTGEPSEIDILFSTESGANSMPSTLSVDDDVEASQEPAIELAAQPPWPDVAGELCTEPSIVEITHVRGPAVEIEWEAEASVRYVGDELGTLSMRFSAQ